MSALVARMQRSGIRGRGGEIPGFRLRLPPQGGRRIRKRYAPTTPLHPGYVKGFLHD